MGSDRWTTLGGPVNLPDTPVADIRADRGRYWRTKVYHEYTGAGWHNTDSDMILVDEGEPLLAVEAFELRQEVTQTVTLRRDLGPGLILIAAGQPLRAALPSRVAMSLGSSEGDPSQPTEEPELLTAMGDPSILYARRALRAGETYQVVSSLADVDEESLRQAGTDYPDEVKLRYLQLPDSLPERVRLLAEQIADGEGTPYDKAKAIEGYLRTIPYNQQIEAPAPGQDGVDYFLFEAGQGYCDYFASAMVVMLRDVGVPARYVRGYSQSRQADGVYRILEWDGHAWPEVFFPGYGWVEFEPTSGESPLNRPSSQDEGAARRSSGLSGPDEQPGLDPRIDTEVDPNVLGAERSGPLSLWQRIGPWGWVLLGLVSCALVAAAVLAVLRRRQIEGLSAAERVYEDLVDWVRRLLRFGPLAHQTPHEYTGLVSQSVPRGRQAVERIADLYVQERFGGKEVSVASADEAWQQARAAIWRRWLGRRTDVFRRFWWRLVPPEEWPGPHTDRETG
jgi:hypothetical protein